MQFCEPRLGAYTGLMNEAVWNNFVSPGGPMCQALEQELAEMSGFDCAVLTNSGTTALVTLSKLASKETEFEDEIIVPAYGVISTAQAFAHLSVKFVDVNPVSGCIDPLQLVKTDKTAAVVWVDFAAGKHQKWAALDWAEQNDVLFFSDSAASCGHGRLTGDAAIYSFSGPKPITGGQGGAVLCNKGDEEVIRSVCDLGLGYRTDGVVSSVGGNFRMSDLAAGLILSQVRKARDIMDRRRMIFDVLKQCGVLELADPPYYNIIHVDDPDETIVKLAEKGIPSKRYHRPFWHHPYWHEDGTHYETLYPGAQYWWNHAVYLPHGNNLTPTDAYEIVEALK